MPDIIDEFFAAYDRGVTDEERHEFALRVFEYNANRLLSTVERMIAREARAADREAEDEMLDLIREMADEYRHRLLGRVAMVRIADARKDAATRLRPLEVPTDHVDWGG